MISVLINAYNYGPFVVEAVQSALAQTVLPYEVIVVDDGSSDNTAELLREWFGSNPLVKVIRQRNSGQLAALVAGLEQASGEIVCFLDADDVYEPNHLESVAAGFAKHRDVDFLYTAHRTFGNENRVVQHAPQDVRLGYSLIVARVIAIRWIHHVDSGDQTEAAAYVPAGPAARRANFGALPPMIVSSTGHLLPPQKLYVAEPTVRYRRHGENHSAEVAHSLEYGFSHNFRRQTLAQLLEDHLGLGDSMYLDLVTEFRSMERPTRLMYGIYCRLNWVVNRRLMTRQSANPVIPTLSIEQGNVERERVFGLSRRNSERPYRPTVLSQAFARLMFDRRSVK